MNQHGFCPSGDELRRLPNRMLIHAACNLLSASRVVCDEVMKIQPLRCRAHFSKLIQRFGASASVGRSLNDSPISESVASTPPLCPLASLSIRCACSVPATQ